MGVNQYKVTIEPAGHPGVVYHIRVWVRRYTEIAEPGPWVCVHEGQADVSKVPGGARAELRRAIRDLAKQL